MYRQTQQTAVKYRLLHWDDNYICGVADLHKDIANNFPLLFRICRHAQNLSNTCSGVGISLVHRNSCGSMEKLLAGTDHWNKAAVSVRCLSLHEKNKRCLEEVLALLMPASSSSMCYKCHDIFAKTESLQGKNISTHLIKPCRTHITNKQLTILPAHTHTHT